MEDLTTIKYHLKKNGGKLIGYARVSTDDQDCAIQVEKLNAIGCQKVYKDQKTGTIVEREQLKQCLDYLREGDVLAFTRVDRLGRSLKDLITIADDLREQGISLFILQQNLNTATPMGQLFYSMLGIISEFEYHLKRERQLEGIAKAKASGKYKGRKPLSYDMVTEVRALKASGVSPTQIAQQLNIGRTTVYKYL